MRADRRRRESDARRPWRPCGRLTGFAPGEIRVVGVLFTLDGKPANPPRMARVILTLSVRRGLNNAEPFLTSYYVVRPASRWTVVEIAPRGNGDGAGVDQSSSPDGLANALFESSFVSGALAFSVRG